ncbi:hypothetical protein Droror1_Dr00027669 [Drosera rotundifolia]
MCVAEVEMEELASETVKLNKGHLEQFTHEMKPFLRKNWIPVKLNKDVVELVADFIVCQAGNPLSPKSAHILIGNPLLRFGPDTQVTYEYFWSHGLISNKVGLTIMNDCQFDDYTWDDKVWKRLFKTSMMPNV